MDTLLHRSIELQARALVVEDSQGDAINVDQFCFMLLRWMGVQVMTCNQGLSIALKPHQTNIALVHHRPREPELFDLCGMSFGDQAVRAMDVGAIEGGWWSLGPGKILTLRVGAFI